MDRRRKQYSTAHLVVDLILTIGSGGLWLIWILIRFLRSNTR